MCVAILQSHTHRRARQQVRACKCHGRGAGAWLPKPRGRADRAVLQAGRLFARGPQVAGLHPWLTPCPIPSPFRPSPAHLGSLPSPLHIWPPRAQVHQGHRSSRKGPASWGPTWSMPRATCWDLGWGPAQGGNPTPQGQGLAHNRHSASGLAMLSPALPHEPGLGVS